MGLFGSKKEEGVTVLDAQSNLSVGLTFKDNKLAGTGSVLLDCIFYGDIDIQDDVIVGETGTIIGNIMATNIVIHGTVQGNIFSNDTTRIDSTGKLVGNANCAAFEVVRGGSFHGSCSMPQRNDISTLLPEQEGKKEKHSNGNQ